MKDERGKPSTLDSILAGFVLSIQFVIAAVILLGLLHLLWIKLPPVAAILTLLAALFTGLALPFVSPRLTQRFLVLFSQYTLS